MPRNPTGRSVGRPAKPVEVKRRTGNPGKRPLPDTAKVTLLPGAAQPPEPARPLGSAGRELWERVWRSGATWLASRVDAEMVLLLCERMDERVALRVKVIQNGDWRERAALRSIDAQIVADLAALGFTPTDRARLGVAEVQPASRIAELLSRKANGGTTS